MVKWKSLKCHDDILIGSYLVCHNIIKQLDDGLSNQEVVLKNFDQLWLLVEKSTIHSLMLPTTGKS